MENKMKVRVAFDPPIKKRFLTEAVEVERAYVDKKGSWVIIDEERHRVYFVMLEK
jgi:hypothetical protein